MRVALRVPVRVELGTTETVAVSVVVSGEVGVSERKTDNEAVLGALLVTTTAADALRINEALTVNDGTTTVAVTGRSQRGPANP